MVWVCLVVFGKGPKHEMQPQKPEIFSLTGMACGKSHVILRRRAQASEFCFKDGCGVLRENLHSSRPRKNTEIEEL